MYCLVVQANTKGSRMYTVATHLFEGGRFSKNTGHKSLGKLYGPQLRGWERFESVMKLLGTTEQSLDAAKKAKERKETNEADEWSFDFVVAKSAGPEMRDNDEEELL